MAGTCVYKYGSMTGGNLARRYKRFLADVHLRAADQSVTCHCPNTGPMTGLLERPEAPVTLSVHDSKTRKYAHSLEMIQPVAAGAWVGVHSAIANKCVAFMLEQRLIEQLQPYQDVLAEVDIAAHGTCSSVPASAAQDQASEDEAVAPAAKRSRLLQHKQDVEDSSERVSIKQKRPRKAVKTRCDFMTTDAGGQKTFVEVKSVTLAEDMPNGGRIALFPDTVSERALRHIEDLQALHERGHKAACVFLIQRSDCEAFAPCHAKDPAYGRAVCKAHAAGVQLIPLLCEVDPKAGEIRFLRQVPCIIDYRMDSGY